jgi:protein O-GlcNAc transferase
MIFLSAQQHLARIQQLQQLGQLAEAERACREALLSMPNSPDILSLHGVLLSHLGRHTEALNQLTRASASAPQDHVILFNLGSVYAGMERFKEAEDCFRRVLAISPSLPEGHYNLGNALKDQERFDEAAAAYRKAIQLRSSYAAAWSNLGSIFLHMVNLPEAKGAIQRALALNQKSPSALNNYATILRNEGQLAKAIDHCVAALSINPNHAESYFTLGSALIASLDYAKAIMAYEKGAALKPASKATLFELVNAYAAAGVHAGIVEGLARILKIDPNDARAQMFLGITQMERGFYDEAYEAFRQSIAAVDDPAVKIRRALSVPPIVASAGDIANLRDGIEKQLDALMTETGIIADPYHAQLGANFFLAYHAKNDRDLQKKVALLYRKYAPSLNFVAPHCSRNRADRPKLKVGFVSRYISRHSVSIAYGDVINALSAEADIETYLISTTDFSNASVKEMFSAFKGTFVCIPASLAYAQQAIAMIELDVLIYLDVGMDPLTFLLAFARLAPAQCVMGGHPDTTGVDTIDYFISAAKVEPEDGDSHYSETLVRMESGGFSFPRPEVPNTFKSRAELGLPLEGNLYFCPMMLQKIHPDFDGTVGRILELDPTSHIVMCESFQHPQWGVLLRERFARVLPAAARERVVFIPWIRDKNDFLSAIAISSVILDPFHFGIGTTGSFCFAVGTPMVTLPGEFMRGRVGLMYCRMLNLMECVADSPESYARLAVEIATTPERRNALQKKIIANNSAIFENKQSSNELAEFIRRTASQAEPQARQEKASA